MVGVLCEITVENGDQIIDLFFFCLSEGGRHDGEGIGNPVLAVIVGKFRHGIERRERPVRFAVMHRVCARRKGLSRLSSVRRRARLLSVNDVGGNGQSGKRVLCAAISGRFAKFFIDLFENFLRNGVHAVVVVAEFGEIARRFEIYDNPLFVFDGLDFSVFDGGKRIGDDAEPRDTERHEPIDIGIVQSHLQLFE